jgi:hypothetical protein
LNFVIRDVKIPVSSKHVSVTGTTGR